ncbi:hypothetical protein BO71DRAFT_436350 [Aspergillus ellipticus CBS 707.79]|uniref:Zn(2)-C6 fungal-type domain-containing protein n=1 Tax=Aspergillus ellipticus CBS 707.79 TaxID=1448320 RepID=A0A319CR43_9EURO|nr:hypothetical protein BO71DRAFT_436350 [Aspergillus ellipticus CBS 707.79]
MTAAAIRLDGRRNLTRSLARKMPQLDSSKAANVCANCKARKKRCDKALPRCRYCADHDLHCPDRTHRSPRYGPPVSARSPQSTSSSSVWRSANPTTRTANPIHASPVPVPIPPLIQTPTPTAPSTLCTQAQHLLKTTAPYLDEISVRYFQGIHSFMPIISRRRFHAQLLSFGALPQTDFALLLLCMAQLPSIPDPAAPSTLQTRYLSIKALLAQAHALCPPTTHLIQAGILLAVYEYAHGFPAQAFLTIGTAARLAYAAGLPPAPSNFLPPAAPDSDWTLEEEQNSTWWGILVCERYASSFSLHVDTPFLNTEWMNRTFLCEIPRPTQPLASPMPPGTARLPLEPCVLDQDQDVLSSPTTTKSTAMVESLAAPRVGGFGRAAQAAWLLDGVLRGLAMEDDPVRKRAYLDDYDQKLQALLAVVMQQCSGD